MCVWGLNFNPKSWLLVGFQVLVVGVHHVEQDHQDEYQGDAYAEDVLELQEQEGLIQPTNLQTLAITSP